MRLYYVHYQYMDSDSTDGIREWFSNKTKAIKRAKQLKREDDNSCQILIYGVVRCDVPKKRDELIGFLNWNMHGETVWDCNNEAWGSE